MAFVHLQVHSEFSVLQSSARLDDILAAAADENAPAVALTDHAAMFGVLEIQTRGKDLNKVRKEKGLPPVKTIYGCHIYVDTSSANQKDPITFERLTLLVENEKGYYNLLRIVSFRYEDGDRWAEIPSVPLSVIEEHKEGIIAIAGDFFSKYGQNVAAGRNSVAREYMESLDKIFDHDHLYISVCNNGVQGQKLLNDYNVKLAGELGREIVAVGDVHYIKPEDAEAHKILRCIALKETLNGFDDKHFPDNGKFYFRSEAEMVEMFGHIPGAIENTVKIAERCNYTVKTGIGDEFWPRFKIPEDFLSSDEYQNIKAIMKAEYDAEYPVVREREVKGVIKDKKKKVTATYCADKGIAEDALTDEDKAEIERLSQPEFFDEDDQKAWDKSVRRWCKPGGDADIYITHLCNQRLKWRFPKEDFKFPAHETDVGKRMYKELNCIRNMNVAGYLLIVWDFINWSREHGIPVGPGRGSAAGSLVTYIIGITDIDPLTFDLLFERFLNPERVSMPDIDTDFADRDRGRVIQYVTDKYGKECVGQIITYGMLKSKAVITDVARVLGLPPAEAKQITKLFPQRTLNFSLKQAWTGKDKKGNNLEDGYSPEPLQAMIGSRASYQNLWDIAKKLEDLPRQTGVHACGVVITPTPIYNLAPLYRAASEDTPVVMYDKHYAEDIGLLKMDFLGLINLSIIQDTVNMVKKNRSIELDMGHIPLDDKETFDLLGKGMTTTVFQFESPGMQKYLRELKPTRIFDLIAMNALYRPGPIDQIPHFIARKNGQEEIDCYHPDLEQVLGETYGVIVYQEQVMKLAQILGGYSLGGADNIRRIMAKKMPEKMAKLEPEFFQKCLDNGYDKAMIQKVWDAVLPFCGYAFNKSHAAAYAYVAYQTAYLKAHYGPEYMAASMTSKMGKTEDIVTIILECKRLDIDVVSPNINASMGEFVATPDKKILFGLAGIRNVGIGVVEDIVAERERRGKFKDIFDFCKRVTEYQGEQKEKRPPMNKRLIESLIMAGALDELPGSRAVLMATVDRAMEVASRFQEDKDRGQMSLFDMGGSAPSMDSSAEVLEEAEEWTAMEMLNKERDVLGMFLSGHPLDEFRPELQGFTTCSLEEEELSRHVGGTVIVGGVVTKLRSIETKRGDTIGAGAIQDFHGDLEMFFKKDLWEKFRDTVALDDRVLVKGSLEQQRMGDGVQIVVEEVIQLDRVRSDMVSHIHMVLYSSMVDDNFTDKLMTAMEKYEPFEGERGCELVCHVETDSGNVHVLALKNKKVVYTPELLQFLRKELGVAKVWVSNRAKR
ncbi:DNA polymerase III subunit alpha [Fibrobacter sp.]|uniref:DNA polymerase III subunit alpha n=1 Tax=Fibrobacter sp. TaxID=35828 RepID=UPI0025C6D0EA|nr:DNA polymerase III subunit alpha [Fibrobacter sp.]MBS7272210.1 DNA polymerase III subunit alpha [Fibrobacter sp.]MCI6437376.1 DNA polymerase III subunit alpha [Fibrobacter sp.]MDD7499126.1 DNA polymerase III subunit alpha [Fibrobacter sp.]MDY5723775.1 DNA polymerase III subunit alpha [Fibrobacter sp.]